MALGKPTLLFDAANTRQLPRRAVFTRATTGIRTDRVLRQAVAPINVPRFDFDPVSGACRGLLIEAQSTNLLADSANVVSWTATGSTVRENDTSPSADGSATASQVNLAGDVSGDVSRSFSVTPGQRYTLSAYYKLLTASNLALAVNNTIAWNTVPGAVYSPGTPEARGIARASLTFTAPSNGSINLHIGGNSNPDAPVQSAGRVQLSCLQLEVGPSPTSYIPAAGSAVTRAADFCSLPMSVASVAGTVLMDFGPLVRGVGNYARIFEVATGVGSDLALYSTPEGGLGLYANDSGGPLFNGPLSNCPESLYAQGGVAVVAYDRAGFTVATKFGNAQSVWTKSADAFDLSQGRLFPLSYKTVNAETSNGAMRRHAQWPRRASVAEAMELLA